MGLSVIRDDQGKLLRIEISCAVCGHLEPEQAIIAGGGLINMGWTKAFDEVTRAPVYYCPDHKLQGSA